MAYVAISGNLIERTEEIINKMEKAELASIPKYSPALSPNSDFLDRAVWKEFAHLKAQLPVDWLPQVESVRVRVKANDQVFTHQFEISGKYSLPPNANYYEGFNVAETETDPEYMRCLAHYTKIAEVKARWGKVSTDVKFFLGSCKSLNEAVKLWPDVEMYIDKADVERMGIKREKARESEALAALAKMDTDMLVGAAVISRMSQAAA